jgi:hypothetical protein
MAFIVVHFYISSSKVLVPEVCTDGIVTTLPHMSVDINTKPIEYIMIFAVTIKVYSTMLHTPYFGFGN